MEPGIVIIIFDGQWLSCKNF